MESISEIHTRANQALSLAVESLDKKIRPTQRAYFACCYACSHESNKPRDVPECLEKCQIPMLQVQDKLSNAQETFQTRISTCHATSGTKVNSEGGKFNRENPTPGQLTIYASSLRPCVERETQNIDSLLEGVLSVIPDALKGIEKATPKTGRVGAWW
jgi:hypothetical protein